MNSFPHNFSSLKEYQNYSGCLAALRPGDRITFPDELGGVHEGFFLFKELRYGGKYQFWQVLVGSELSNSIFHMASALEKRAYVSPAKKLCPKIRIGQTYIHWIGHGQRLTKIVKFHGEKEKEEKKAGDKKPVRARRKNA